MSDNREISERDLERVGGGAAGPDFSSVAEEFAWRNRCADCPNKSIYRPHAMCLEVYGELLQDFLDDKSIAMRCKRRK